MNNNNNNINNNNNTNTSINNNISNNNNNNNNKRSKEMKMKATAKFAGLLYLLIAIFGGFAFFGGYESLIVKGNAALTTTNILESEFMFRIGIIGDSFTFLGEIILTILLYKIFKPVNKTWSQIAAFSRLGLSRIEIANLRGTSLSAVKSGRARLKSKLGLASGENLDIYIKSIKSR